MHKIDILSHSMNGRESGSVCLCGEQSVCAALRMGYSQYDILSHDVEGTGCILKWFFIDAS